MEKPRYSRTRPNLDNIGPQIHPSKHDRWKTPTKKGNYSIKTKRIKPKEERHSNIILTTKITENDSYHSLISLNINGLNSPPPK